MNKFIAHGRLTKDPEAKNTKDYQITRITVAIDRGYGDKRTTDFIPFTAFGKTAEFICKYFTKGSEIIITAEVRTDNYEKEGQKVYGYSFVVNEVEFAGSKKRDVASELEGFDEIQDLKLPF